MGNTATASLGFGIKVNTESFEAKGMHHQYREDILDEEQYPALNVKLSGFAPENSFWVFANSTTQVLHSGASGLGMETTVNLQMQITEEEKDQLAAWAVEHGQSETPSWNFIQYFN